MSVIRSYALFQLNMNIEDFGSQHRKEPFGMMLYGWLHHGAKLKNIAPPMPALGEAGMRNADLKVPF